MSLYCGIDLHSTNSFVAVADEQDQVVLAKRLPNRLEVILRELEPVREEIAGLAVESTFNWYWLGGRSHGRRISSPSGQHLRRPAVRRTQVLRRPLGCSLAGSSAASRSSS